MSLADKTIVVVDDEPDTAEMFADMIRLSGFTVHKCYGSYEAVRVIRQKRPDAVVLDVMMPDASGLDVLRYLKRHEELKHIPVVVVSARTLPEDVRAALEAGAHTYLTKPVAFLELKQAVEDALSGNS